MLWPKKNSYKVLDDETKFLRLENSPPPPPPMTFLMVRSLVPLIVLLLVRSTLSYMQIKSLFASSVNTHFASNYPTLSLETRHYSHLSTTAIFWGRIVHTFTLVSTSLQRLSLYNGHFLLSPSGRCKEV